MSGLDLAEIQPGGLTADVSSDVTIEQILSGSGALAKTGANKLTLSGVNSFAGNTTISAGTLAIGTGGSISSSPTINLASAATLDTSAGGFAVSGSQTFAAIQLPVREM